MPIQALPIPDDHPALPGHFPGHPIIPGAVLLDHALLVIESALGVKLGGVSAAKFLNPAVPGDTLTLEFEPASHYVAFTILAGTRKIASGRFDISPLAGT